MNSFLPKIIGSGHHGHGGFSLFGWDFGLITGFLLMAFIAIAIAAKIIRIKNRVIPHRWHRIGVYGAVTIMIFHGIYNYIVHFRR